MFAEERQQDIIARLKRTQKVSVAELSERYSVTTATIRNDLKILEELNLIVKTHGGAMLKSQTSFELASDTRKTINFDKKALIGELAAGLISNNETILIDTGTTAIHIAYHLKKRSNITVVTNDFEVAKELEPVDGVQIIFLGGVVKKNYHCTYHIDSHALINSLHVDKAFMGTNAFSLQNGASVADINLSETKRAMIKHANQVIIICDSSKLGKSSLSQFAAIEDVDMLITDSLPEDHLSYTEVGINVITPSNIPE